MNNYSKRPNPTFTHMRTYTCTNICTLVSVVSVIPGILNPDWVIAQQNMAWGHSKHYNNNISWNKNPMVKYYVIFKSTDLDPHVIWSVQNKSPPQHTHLYETLSYSLVIIHIFTGERKRDKVEKKNETELFLHKSFSHIVVVRPQTSSSRYQIFLHRNSVTHSGVFFFNIDIHSPATLLGKPVQLLGNTNC